MGHPSYIDVSQVIDFDDWSREEEVPTGSREKATLIDPKTGLHHIYKFPGKHREHQVWSELLASCIAGDLLGWDVQHTSIACLGNRHGNLLRYVYEPESETFTEGWQFCTRVDPDFDVVKGTRHTLPLIIRVCDGLLDKDLKRDDFMDFWARGLALDTLISNTDRHAENWAIIEGPKGVRMAPLYDNGSSLECGTEKVRLDRAFDADGKLKAAHLEKQRQKGRHHLRLDKPEKCGGTFEDVCIAFPRHYPEGRHRFERAKGVDIDAVGHLMNTIAERIPLPDPYSLSERRRQHIYAMLQIGVERIRNVLCKA
ncbi:MAG: HipA domain-containing protein [Rhodobacteraceae bacterium]|nr:HipA domain-containing protein [Paracoccaceae bacterium]